MNRTRNLAVYAAIALAALSFLWLGLAVGRLWRAAAAVREDVRRLESLASGPSQDADAREAIRLVYAVHADLTALERAARPFLWLAPYAGWVPRYGPDVEAAPALLGIALDLSSAAQEIATPLLPLLGEDGPQVPVGEVLSVLDTLRPQLVEGLSAVRRAQVSRQDIVVDPLTRRVRGWVARLDKALPVVEQGIVSALVAPKVLGAGRERTYLVLVQNEDELRATGGFISGVARVSVADGALSSVSFEDSYAVDDFARQYPDPPEPLLEYMLSELWLFRDSNWSPDFPTSARAAVDLYSISRDGAIDGVLALDQRAIQMLVGALGPLQVPGVAEPVTGENVVRVAREAWKPDPEASGDWWTRRKDIMGAVLDAAAQRLGQGVSRGDLVALGNTILHALNERHVLLYVADRQIQDQLAEAGWDGAVLESPGDYLYVVDTNMGFNKANALVEEEIEYEVDLSDLDQPRGALTVRHHHTLQRPVDRCVHEPRYDETYEQLMERCYWDYLRVLVPAGSELLSATSHTIPGEELLSGRTSAGEVVRHATDLGPDAVATLLLVRPGETLETRFEYALPSDVLQELDGAVVYELLVQKQPGTDSTPLRVRVSLPDGVTMQASDPHPDSISDSVLEYALALATDQRMGLTLVPEAGQAVWSPSN